MSPPIHPSQVGRCRLKRTVLLVGEGPMEWAFLRHVVQCFVPRDCAVAAKVENANGGAPEVVLSQVRKLLPQRAYQRCVILMDTDRPWPVQLPSQIGRVQITYVRAEPVLKGLLLRIAGHVGITVHTPVVECKRALYRDYLDEKRRTEMRAYARSFPRARLEASRPNCSALDTILRVLE